METRESTEYLLEVECKNCGWKGMLAIRIGHPFDDYTNGIVPRASSHVCCNCGCFRLVRKDEL